VPAVLENASQFLKKKKKKKNLAQGRFAEAEPITREVLDVKKRVLGEEHPSTLASAHNLGHSLFGLGKHAEAEQIQRKVLDASRRIHGEEHPHTLTEADQLAQSLSAQRKFAEAEQVYREVLDVTRRVMGEEHHDTLGCLSNFAMTLADQFKFAAAEQMLKRVLAAQQRTLGANHPVTRNTAQSLEGIREDSRFFEQAAKAAAPPRWPAGTHVLVQRLVAKPQYNGQRARVLSFDERGGVAGRYKVVLDDGKELLLKPECVARAGCAAAGCTSEDAISVCARCQAVRYCSQQCQRAHWKAHKPTCAAAQPAAP
jgi:tetratricopeptide (TPR) repeat protein